MTRKDLHSTFTMEGDMSTREQQTYVYKDCPYIKVNVVFSYTGATEAEDRIVSVSPPYLAFPLWINEGARLQFLPAGGLSATWNFGRTGPHPRPRSFRFARHSTRKLLGLIGDLVIWRNLEQYRIRLITPEFRHFHGDLPHPWIVRGAAHPDFQIRRRPRLFHGVDVSIVPFDP